MRVPVIPVTPEALRRTHPLDSLVAGWFFRCSEVSAGCYAAEGRDLYGREVSRQSTDADAALQECVAFALASAHLSSAA